MSLTNQYFALQQHFDKKYGDKVCLLMMVGKFYEVYEYLPSYENQQLHSEENQGNIALRIKLKDNNFAELSIDPQIDTSKPIGCASSISLILGMKLTSKNKDKPHSIGNPLMMGFPCPSYDTHKDLILLNGYTIVRIDQKNKNAKETENVEREVTEIVSPGTVIDSSIVGQVTGTNTIVSIYIECQKAKRNTENNVLVCGFSCLDVSTGQSLVNEVYSKETDEVHALQELYRFLLSQQPAEILLNINRIPEEQKESYKRDIQDTLELDKYTTSIVRCNELDPNFLKLEYQEEFLRKAFQSEKCIRQVGSIGACGVIDELNLEMFHYGRISYIALLQHCYEHNETLIKKLQKPQVKWSDGNLILTHNALNQLDLFSKQTGLIPKKSEVYDSLLSVLDISSTSLGSRYLRRQLLNPITDPDKLESFYAMTEELVKDPSLLQEIKQSLRRIPDIEKLQRKIEIGIITPKEFVSLFRAYVQIQEIYRLLFTKCFESNEENKKALRSLFMSKSDTTDFNECLTEIYSMVNFDKLQKVKFNRRGKDEKLQCDDAFINPGYDTEIDNIQQTLQQYQNWLQLICDHLNGFLGNTRGKKIVPTFERCKSNKKAEEEDEEENESEMTVSLFTTKHKAKVIRGCSSQINQQLCGSLEFYEMKSNTMITSDLIKQCCNGVEQYQLFLEQRLLVKFYDIVQKVAKRSYFSGINNFIATLDFVKTNAETAVKYKYFRPVIDNTVEQSYFDVKNLRHPLIERIIRSEYIPNDISLNNKGPNGLLLFGVNSTGKSSLAKAMGIAIIMAQAGMWVAGNLVYKPYTKIITRLSGNDDLLKGQSSFVVEMSELRTILRNADANTLVLGDELCRGTESSSGTSLTVATIETLVQRGCSFIFSTHMHHLPDIDIIKSFNQAGKLRIAHLTATYDEKLEKLIYNRRLEDGAGSSLYGLEVCKSLAISQEFIDRANSIRRQFENIPQMFLSTKTSRYNSRVYVDKCSLCQKLIDLQTHHIEEQNKADERGYIEHYHKNSSFNLTILCKSCHTWLHSAGLQLIRKQTLNGVYLEAV